MKTAESLLKEKIGKFVVDYAIDHVNQWAKQELNYVRYALDYPVVVPVNKNWVIGKFYVKNIGPHRYHVSADGKEIHTFYSKQAAIFYAVFTKVKCYKTADTLLEKDQLTAKLFDEFERYGKKLVNSKKADNFKYQLWQTRYLESKSRLAVAKEDLEKKLISAKYNKIWDKIL